MTFDELNIALGGHEDANDWHQHSNGNGWIHKDARADITAYVGPDAIVYGEVCDNARVEDFARVHSGACVGGTAIIRNHAVVRDKAVVKGKAVVADNAQISGYAMICDEASIRAEAFIYENAIIRDHAEVGEKAQIFGYAFIGGFSQVYGDVRIGNNAKISGYANIKGNAHIYGDTHICGDSVVGEGMTMEGGKWEISPLYIRGSRYALYNHNKGSIQIGCYRLTFQEWLDKGEEIAYKHNFTDAQIEEYRAYVELFIKIGQ